MNLLPLQIILGFQVAAAIVIGLQLLAGESETNPQRLRKARVTAAKRRLLTRSLDGHES
ncbi:MAG: hypothetical protein ABW006_02285 [Hyphomicrobium sp.]